MLISLTRSIILYVCLVFAIRLMGKRQIGQLEPSEFVVAMLLADLAAAPVQDLAIPLLAGIVPIFTVMAAELFLSVLSYWHVGVRKVLCGSPVLLMEHGKIISENLKKTRLTPEELMEQLREKDIFDLSVIQYAILETNGQISAMIDSRYKPPTAEQMGKPVERHGLPVLLVSSGKFASQEFTQIPVSELWIRSELDKRNCSLEDVVLFTRDENGKLYLAVKKENA